MLKITRIHVRNFLSFKECTFELEDLQLLIGPNNSGKTNLLRVFEFLGQMIDPQRATDIDLESIYFQHKRSQEKRKKTGGFPDPVEITIQFTTSTKANTYYYYKIELYTPLFDPKNGKHEKAVDFQYNEFIGFALNRLSNDQFKSIDLFDLVKLHDTFKESYLIRNFTLPFYREPLKDSIQNNNQNTIAPDSYILWIFDDYYYYSEGSSIGTFLQIPIISSFDFGDIGVSLSAQLKKLAVYKPNVAYIKLPIEIFEVEEVIKGDCENIVPYLENLLSSDPDRFQWINDELNRCIPDYKGYNFTTVPEPFLKGGTPQNVRYLRLKDKFGVNYLAKDISDGTLYFLMLLAIIHQRNMPSILMLEEPETGIHPRRIGEIMEYLLQLQEQYPNLSIIVTTHHPYLVDMFSNMPDRIWVIDNNDGETIVKNLERDIIEPSNEKMKAEGIEPIDYTSSLGDHWVLGFLGGVPKPVDHRPNKERVK